MSKSKALENTERASLDGVVGDSRIELPRLSGPVAQSRSFAHASCPFSGSPRAETPRIESSAVPQCGNMLIVLHGEERHNATRPCHAAELS